MQNVNIIPGRQPVQDSITESSVKLCEYVDKNIKLQLLKDLVRLSNQILHQKEMESKNEIQKLHNLQDEAWNLEDIFSEDVWTFSENHFHTIFKQHLKSVKIIKQINMQDSNISAKEEYKSISNGGDVSKKLENVKRLKEEIAVIEKKITDLNGDDITKRNLNAALAELENLKQFLFHDPECLRLRSALEFLQESDLLLQVNTDERDTNVPIAKHTVEKMQLLELSGQFFYTGRKNFDDEMRGSKSYLKTSVPKYGAISTFYRTSNQDARQTLGSTVLSLSSKSPKKKEIGTGNKKTEYLREEVKIERKLEANSFSDGHQIKENIAREVKQYDNILYKSPVSKSVSNFTSTGQKVTDVDLKDHNYIVKTPSSILFKKR